MVLFDVASEAARLLKVKRVEPTLALDYHDRYDFNFLNNMIKDIVDAQKDIILLKNEETTLSKEREEKVDAYDQLEAQYNDMAHFYNESLKDISVKDAKIALLEDKLGKVRNLGERLYQRGDDKLIELEGGLKKIIERLSDTQLIKYFNGRYNEEKFSENGLLIKDPVLHKELLKRNLLSKVFSDINKKLTSRERVKKKASTEKTEDKVREILTYALDHPGKKYSEIANETGNVYTDGSIGAYLAKYNKGFSHGLMSVSLVRELRNKYGKFIPASSCASDASLRSKDVVSRRFEFRKLGNNELISYFHDNFKSGISRDELNKKDSCFYSVALERKLVSVMIPNVSVHYGGYPEEVVIDIIDHVLACKSRNPQTKDQIIYNLVAAELDRSYGIIKKYFNCYKSGKPHGNLTSSLISKIHAKYPSNRIIKDKRVAWEKGKVLEYYNSHPELLELDRNEMQLRYRELYYALLDELSEEEMEKLIPKTLITPKVRALLDRADDIKADERGGGILTIEDVVKKKEEKDQEHYGDRGGEYGKS